MNTKPEIVQNFEKHYWKLKSRNCGDLNMYLFFWISNHDFKKNYLIQTGVKYE